VICSAEPVDAWATFYPNSRKLDEHSAPIMGRVDGRSVHFELKEPKLRPPAMLAVSVRRDDEKEIVVKRVERLP
jgi:hypothetical protein